jgi:hypothetical protein
MFAAPHRQTAGGPRRAADLLAASFTTSLRVSSGSHSRRSVWPQASSGRSRATSPRALLPGSRSSTSPIRPQNHASRMTLAPLPFAFSCFFCRDVSSLRLSFRRHSLWRSPTREHRRGRILALGFGSRGGLLPRRLERRRTEDLYDVGVSLGSRPQTTPVGPRRVGLGTSWLGCIPVEGLAASGRL